ncbi:MAG TPA: carboxypeptidase-like regulatory domain-containing protein [Pyrinomonadaceae bacterium]|nr:carboxypeptidase-like regulatory domain-containing protein [Pyrinomonadaceae bacterium]
MKSSFLICLVLLACAPAAAQSGGGFNLEQNVIGNGGWRSDGGGFTVLGTMGQSNSGSTAAGGRFHLIDGLWATENQAESSPFATVTGRLAKQDGTGIPRVLVTITNANANFRSQTWTGAHGEYRIENIPTGANYVIAVSHNNFEFEPASIALFISQDRSDINFVSPHP